MNENALGERLARVVDRISRGEFKLLAIEVEKQDPLDDPNTLQVHLTLRRTPPPGEGPPRYRSKRGRRVTYTPRDIIRDLIFDDDDE